MRSWRLAAACVPLAALAGCRPALKPGVSDVPPLPRYEPGTYTDINPRWSHDGSRIAFLRSTPDRRLQLVVTDSELERTSALLEAEIVSPDRPYDSQALRYSSPDTLAWSPDDHKIAFERAEWFKFDDGQRLPGTAIWSFDVHSGRVSPLALHPKRYTSFFYYYHDPQWSPDGGYVAFVAEGINGQRLIAVRCVPVENPKEVAPRFDNYASSDWPVWRGAGANSDRSRSVLGYVQSIFRTANLPATATLRSVQPGSADGSQCRELLRIEPNRYAADPVVRRGTLPGETPQPRIGHPAWSPDGGRIAFTVTPDANNYARYELWVLDAASGKARRVSPDERRGYVAPVWIDNERIGALSPNGGRFDVVAIEPSRRSRQVLGTIETADCDWSPDRTRIVYAAPASQRPNTPEDVTTLRFFETHIAVRSK